MNKDQEPIKVFTVTKNGKRGHVYINRDTKTVIEYELKNIGLTDEQINKIRERIQKAIK